MRGHTVRGPLSLARSIATGRPLLCLWQITGRCNFTCQICTFWREPWKDKDTLNVEQLALVSRRLREAGSLMVTLAGGEPLLRSDLPDIVETVARDHYCSIVSNGWLMTRALARDLFRRGLADAMVSIDYATPELHDRQRGIAGAFDHAIAAIEALRDANPDPRTQAVRILSVLLDDNLRELEGLAAIAEELGVRLALTLYSDRMGTKPDRLPREEVSRFLLDLKRRHPCLDTSEEYLAEYDRACRRDAPAPCGGGKHFLVVNPLGQVARCADRNDEPAGSLLDHSWTEIARVLEQQRRSAPCRECWTSCRGLTETIAGKGRFRRALRLGSDRFHRAWS